ncbi:hypothetical protein FDW96_09725 [Citrobacter sp. TBCS-15]|nr:hypothetical protein FDW89_01400 [Citrobacter sp. wls830]TKU07919.1 hypothetical protein FDW96_09725 [Citrobacter sp. TBCS-15]TKU48819.1 hypothetical protein FDX11_09265 [Citrobacter sp. wls714]TKU73248.1 hypothetical protein FDX14_12580 [Citrobacter sp. wls710]TKU75299.1 hypothetical protein FDW92_11860 [Citrobacter sp. wls706]TKV15413.1 hypothetical protein FDX04_08985 [Citrobacter sp. wls615]
MIANGVNDGAKTAPFWREARQNRAIISDKFRIRSQFQNYIWQLNKTAVFPLFSRLMREHIHFLCA